MLRLELYGGQPNTAQTAWADFHSQQVFTLFSECLGSVSSWKMKVLLVKRLPEITAWYILALLQVNKLIPDIITARWINDEFFSIHDSFSKRFCMKAVIVHVFQLCDQGSISAACNCLNTLTLVTCGRAGFLPVLRFAPLLSVVPCGIFISILTSVTYSSQFKLSSYLSRSTPKSSSL